jgi:hypothetical protein
LLQLNSKWEKVSLDNSISIELGCAARIRIAFTRDVRGQFRPLAADCL